MSWALVLRHCAAIRATLDQTRVSLELQSAQLAALEAYAKAQDAPRAEIALHPICASVAEERCGIRSEDAWQERSSFAGRERTCVGCGYVEGT